MVEFKITEVVIPKLIGGMNLLNLFDICLKENYSQGGVNGERDLFERNEDSRSRYPITIDKKRHDIHEI